MRIVSLLQATVRNFVDAMMFWLADQSVSILAYSGPVLGLLMPRESGLTNPCCCEPLPTTLLLWPCPDQNGATVLGLVSIHYSSLMCAPTCVSDIMLQCVMAIDEMLRPVGVATFA